MPDLETLLEETKPRPRPEFTERLERRVEAGFPKEPRPGRAKRRSTGTLFRPAFALACTVLLAVVVAAGVTSRSADEDPGTFDSGGGSAEVAPAPSAPSPSAAPAPSAAEPLPTTPLPPEDRARNEGGIRGGSAPPSVRDRAVERRTQLALETPEDEFAEVTAGVLRVTDGAGGIVQRSDVTERQGRGYATYDLRIPTDRLDAALADLSELADVRSRTASTEDITGVTISARDRLQDARDERRALLRRLARADSDREARAIRAQLRLARRSIAAAEADVRRLERRARLSVVTVTVRSTGEEGAWTPGDALGDAARVLEVMAGALLVVGAVLLPFALLAALGLAAARVTRRRRREAALG